MGQAPWPARDALVPLLLWMRVLRRKKRPTRGSAADVGVRPTICVDVRKWENYVALGNIARPTKRGIPNASSRGEDLLAADGRGYDKSCLIGVNRRSSAANKISCSAGETKWQRFLPAILPEQDFGNGPQQDAHIHPQAPIPNEFEVQAAPVGISKAVPSGNLPQTGKTGPQA